MEWDKIFTLFGVLLLLPGMVQGGTSFHPLFQESDEKRGYWVYLPDRHQGSNLLPVVLVLHGEEMDGESMIRLCNLNEKADEAGFLAVYPNGTGQKDKKLTWMQGGAAARPNSTIERMLPLSKMSWITWRNVIRRTGQEFMRPAYRMGP